MDWLRVCVCKRAQRKASIGAAGSDNTAKPWFGALIQTLQPCRVCGWVDLVLEGSDDEEKGTVVTTCRESP